MPLDKRMVDKIQLWMTHDLFLKDLDLFRGGIRKERRRRKKKRKIVIAHFRREKEEEKNLSFSAKDLQLGA